MRFLFFSLPLDWQKQSFPLLSSKKERPLRRMDQQANLLVSPSDLALLPVPSPWYDAHSWSEAQEATELQQLEREIMMTLLLRPRVHGLPILSKHCVKQRKEVTLEPPPTLGYFQLHRIEFLRFSRISWTEGEALRWRYWWMSNSISIYRVSSVDQSTLGGWVSRDRGKKSKKESNVSISVTIRSALSSSQLAWKWKGNSHSQSQSNIWEDSNATPWCPFPFLPFFFSHFSGGSLEHELWLLNTFIEFIKGASGLVLWYNCMSWGCPYLLSCR